MGAILLMLVQSLFSALFTIFSRPLAIKLTQAQFQVTAVVFTGLYAITLPIAFMVSPVYLSDLWNWLPMLIGIGIAFGLSNVGMFWVLRYMDAALSALLGTLGIVAAVVMATIFLGEGLSYKQLIGAACILGAIWYVLVAHVNKNERHSWKLGLFISIGTALLMGVGATGEKYLLDNMQVGSYLVWGWGFQWLVIVVCSFLFGARQYKQVLNWSNARLLGLSSLMRTLGALGFVAGQVIIGNLSKVVILSGLRVLMVALLGVFILHERQFIKRKIIAAVIAAVGVAVMFW